MPFCHYAVLSLRRFLITPFSHYAVFSLRRFLIMPFSHYTVLSLYRFVIKPLYIMPLCRYAATVNQVYTKFGEPSEPCEMKAKRQTPRLIMRHYPDAKGYCPYVRGMPTM